MEINKKPLILIVDDTPQNIQVLAKIFYDKGYGINVAYSGKQALQSLKEQLPDLILLDIQMPGMNGYEVCEALKKSQETMDIPVIFLTAKTETENLLKGFSIGAVDYITKPFNIAELTVRVATHIELKLSREKIRKEKEITKVLNEKLTLANSKLNVAYNDITNSIQYASNIQENMLPDLNFLSKKGIKHMVIYKPKDIISGDFYWAENIEKKIFLAVVDCTGHGVPGALLSVLGHNLLYEIIKLKNIHDPAEILNTLNVKLRKILKHDITSNQDGMDIALCVIDTIAETIEYAGAKRPVFYFRNKIHEELPYNKFSIGGIDTSNFNFTKHSFPLKSGDRFFMFTDGITDQFENSDKKKLTKKRLEQQLSLYAHEPFSTIKKDLLKFLKAWQGSNEQTDDILIMGIEIP